jgi:hypothetical protein
MKNNLYPKLLPALLAIAVFFAACRFAKNTNPATALYENKENPLTDLEGAAAYEFNMIKNPFTGRIPEGIFEMEKEQAKQLIANQMNERPAAGNSYIFQGPGNLGGRTRAVAYDVRFDGVANRVIIAGGVSGGVYKSTDDGATWTRKSPLGEHFSCTSIAQDTRIGFRDTWYYTVGEASGNSASGGSSFYSGNGVYQSTDNGETWSRLTGSNTTALESFSVPEDIINKIIVDPTDGHLYIACAATIRKSVDDGLSWYTVLTGPLSFANQFTDIVVSSTGRLYASFGGTNGSGVDGVWASPPGATSGEVGSWTRIAGLGVGGSPVGWNAETPPPGPGGPGSYGRVVLAIPPSAETFLYALYFSSPSPACPAATPEAELFRWDDIGGTWTDLSAGMPDEAGCLSGNDPFSCQTGYDLVMAVKPDAPGTLFIGGTNAYRSTDAGLTWTRIGGYAGTGSYSLYSGSHPDIHAFAFQPGTPTTMLCGNDGGIQRTTANLAATVAWTPINTGYRTYQYYYVTLDPRLSNEKVLGGAQDNGSTRNIGGTGSSFEMVYGGDGVSVGLSDDFAGTTYEYVGSQNGYINRRTAATALGFTTDITPTFANTVTSAGLFVTLFRLDPDNTDMLYYANDDSLHRTSSASTVTSGTWTNMTAVATTVGLANDITALATTRGSYSAATSSLFIGTSNAKVYRLDNPIGVAAGTAPVNISSASFPATGYVSSIAVNPRNDDTAIVTFSNYGVSGIWWTGDANSATPTWTAIENTTSFFLPSMRSSAIIVNGGTVEYYVGTSVGLYSTTSIAGASTVWTQEGSSTIGNALVSSLAFRPIDKTLLVGTHGYGMWKATISGALPTHFISFTGKPNSNANFLEWRVENENNCKNYVVEKRDAATGTFKTIGSVNCNGTGQYQFSDFNAGWEAPAVIYRIKQTDLDNHFVYSNFLTIRRGIQNSWVQAVTISKSQLYLRISKEDASEKFTCTLLDFTGKQILRKELAKIAQAVSIPANLASGIYIVQLDNTKDGKYTSRIKID